MKPGNEQTQPENGVTRPGTPGEESQGSHSLRDEVGYTVRPRAAIKSDIYAFRREEDRDSVLPGKQRLGISRYAGSILTSLSPLKEERYRPRTAVQGS